MKYLVFVLCSLRLFMYCGVRHDISDMCNKINVLCFHKPSKGPNMEPDMLILSKHISLLMHYGKLCYLIFYNTVDSRCLEHG